ncbi:MAG: DNA replication and repair protein RecF [Gemmatimonadales bacterium]|nr:DNA replication and repair protein RecF [Gemmatimonadales bacterium]
MRLERLTVRGFRNLAELDRDVPAGGLAVLGRNGQGKTNLLEAIYYPVLFRSMRGAADAEVGTFGGPGFHVTAHVSADASEGDRRMGATYQAAGRRKRITLDGADLPRLADALGHWIAVAFLPADVALASGGAAARRQYLDRMLALADRGYLVALTRFRAALAQRNSALRQNRLEVAQAFDAPLARAGATVVSTRLAWIARAAQQFSAELADLGETAAATLRYRGATELADVAAWPPALAAALARDRVRGLSTVGPHRDDIVLEVGGRELRTFGSTGQQRSAAIALKLVELETLGRARGTEPALLLDDVFAELDGERQRRLAERLVRPDLRQVFITAPRPDEMPHTMGLPVWTVSGGQVETQ